MLDWVGGQHHVSVTLPLGKRLGTHCTGGWVGLRVSMDKCGKSRPIGIRTPERPARIGIRSPELPAGSESLYRLSYRGPHT
jgi:hypothetical protein